jgi:hypothetical protein
MEKCDISVLRHISDTLDGIFDYISKPPSKWVQIFNTVVAIVGILGIIAIVDVLLSWIKT